MSHTPGPWTVDPDLPTIINDSSHNPRTVAGCGNGTPRSETEANARLIAAAPELLDALQKVRILLDGLGHNSEQEALQTEKIDRVCRDAIAKAEGRS